MIHKIYNPSILLCFFAMVTAICLDPVIIETEESQSDLKFNNAVSHLLDGKKFIGPTGEKDKKVDHEDVLSWVWR